MRQNPSFTLSDPAAIKQLVRENPWAILVSAPETGLVASHYPVLVDEDRDELSVVTHVGRPDDRLLEAYRATDRQAGNVATDALAAELAARDLSAA